MPPVLRRLVVVLVSSLLAPAVLGCGGRDRVLEPGLTQQEADDLVQALAAMAASDSGGWFLQVEDAFERVRGTPVAPGATPAAVAGVAPVNRGGMTWNFSYSYFDTAGRPQSGIDPTTRLVRAFNRGSGRIALMPHQGVTGAATVRLHQEILDVDGMGTSDTTYTFEAQSDTVEALVTVQSGGGPRYYHFDNIVDYTLEILKSATTPLPLRGEMDIDAFVGVLRSPTPGDRSKILDAKMIVTLDGTWAPRATIQAVTTRATTVYEYRIHLKTGAVVP